MDNSGKVLSIVGVGVLLYFVSSKIRNMVKSVLPESVRGLISGGNPHSGANFDKLYLYCSMQSRDNVYSSPAVIRGEIVFPPDGFLHEMEAKRLAGKIFNANFRFTENDVRDNFIAWGISLSGVAVDNPNTVLEVFLSFKNALQLAQVAYWYNRATGKNLADGIMWLPETMVKQVYDKVNWFDENIGAYWSATGTQLTYAEFRDLMKGKYSN